MAIVAIDPTSPFTGGAILGDRVRMQDHHADPGVFVRSMATRGQLGGLAAATSDLALLFDAGGYDVVLIETVGAGQDEVDVARVADVTLVVMVPGLGDDIQAIKAGIMEIADVFVLNKADLPGIEVTEQELRSMLALAPRGNDRTPPIVRSSAVNGTGARQLVEAIRGLATANEKAGGRAIAMWSMRLRQMYREHCGRRLSEQQVAQAAAEVAARRQDPWTIIEQW